MAEMEGANTSSSVHSVHSEDAPRQAKQLTRASILRWVLAMAIFQFSVAPIFLHHSTVQPLRPHQLRHVSTSSRRVGKRATLETVKYAVGNKEAFNFAYEDEHGSDVMLPRNIGAAGRSLLLSALEKRPVWDEEIDPEVEAERCRRYFMYDSPTKYFTDYKARKRRRLFLGSLIADDSWHALGAVAMETFGVYAAVAFVESNRTQTGTPRKLRFANGTIEHNLLVESNLFGPNTPVLLDQFVHEKEVPGKGLVREHMQRHKIIELWKKAGMTPDDIGVLTDADETPTRDFLRAVQMCDMPELDPEEQDCHTAKVIVSSMVFEGSPECMTTTRKWMHPDLILGKCIDGIGDDKYRLKKSQRQHGAWRRKEFTQKFTNYSGWPKGRTTYPLWNAADFRRDQGGHAIYFEEVDYLKFGMGQTGYHFHNYFETLRQLRNKYTTYGHAVEGAHNMTVGEMHPDLDVMVDCVLGRNTSGNKHETLSTPLEEFEGRIPIAYGLEGYTMARHTELKNLLLEDRLGHDRTWHHNPQSKDWYENIPS
ncbi:hypothetical protein ACHAXT_004632 [Thalassiosira profunda]